MENGIEAKKISSFGIVGITILVFSLFFRPIVHGETTVRAINIGYVPLISQLPLVVSYDNDRLSYSRVKVRLVKYRSLNSLEAALRVGAIDVADLPLPVVFSIAEDSIGVRILGQYHSGGSILEGRGLRNLSDFRGKIIGVPGLRSNENLELIQLLSEEKLRYGLDYKTIKVPFNTVLPNLEAGKINAMYFPEPYGTMAEKSHLATQMEKRVKDSSLELTTVLVARAEIVQEHSLEAMNEWMQSLVEACSFIENDIKTLSAEQTAIIQEPYFGFERILVSSSLTKRRGGIRFSFVIPEKNILQLTLKQALDLKIVQKPVDIDSLLFTHVFKWKKKEGSVQ
jgi:ABC-type nitrate/sulfonate/bicarbonate transport system substrate-binding protein